MSLLRPSSAWIEVGAVEIVLVPRVKDSTKSDLGTVLGVMPTTSQFSISYM